MNTSPLIAVVVLCGATALWPASAQSVAAGAAAASAPASAAPAEKLPPRPVSAAEMIQNARQDADARGERPVTPQIAIPLSRTPPQRGRAAAAAAPDDAARCEALRGEQVREKCRDQLETEARRRAAR